MLLSWHNTVHRFGGGDAVASALAFAAFEADFHEQQYGDIDPKLTDGVRGISSSSLVE